jgi:hypothetical protein
MARTLKVPVRANSLAGLDLDAGGFAPPGTGANNGITFVNNGRVVAVVRNVNAAACVVTKVIGKTAADGAAVTSPTESVGANTGLRVLGPFAPGSYNDSTGQMSLDFGTVTATVQLVEIPRV